MRRRSAFGWGEVIIGIAMIIMGVYAFIRPSSALTGLVFVYGIIAIATGIMDIVFYVRLELRSGFGPIVSLITGIISTFAGILLLFNPGAGRWALILLFPLWFIAHCISRLMNLSFIRISAGTGYYHFALIVNIIGLILGLLMFFNPIWSFFSVSYVIGAYLILAGIDHIALALSNIGGR